MASRSRRYRGPRGATPKKQYAYSKHAAGQGFPECTWPAHETKRIISEVRNNAARKRTTIRSVDRYGRCNRGRAAVVSDFHDLSRCIGAHGPYWRDGRGGRRSLV